MEIDLNTIDAADRIKTLEAQIELLKEQVKEAHYENARLTRRLENVQLDRDTTMRLLDSFRSQQAQQLQQYAQQQYVNASAQAFQGQQYAQALQNGQAMQNQPQGDWNDCTCVPGRADLLA